MDNLDAAKALVCFGADIDALNFNQETPLDIARNRNHSDLADLLMSVGSELGYIVKQRLENFVSLPKAPVYNEKDLEDENLDWFELSTSRNVDNGPPSLSRSMSLRAEESYSVWLEWRKKRQVHR